MIQTKLNYVHSPGIFCRASSFLKLNLYIFWVHCFPILSKHNFEIVSFFFLFILSRKRIYQFYESITSPFITWKYFLFWSIYKQVFSCLIKFLIIRPSVIFSSSLLCIHTVWANEKFRFYYYFFNLFVELNLLYINVLFLKFN